MDRLALPPENVEGDELRRNLGRQLADPTLGRVQSQLHRVEVEDAVTFDHDLAVECRVGRQQLSDLAELREVTE